MSSLTDTTEARQPIPFPLHGSKKILLVDDDARVLRLLSQVLHADGYRVIACKSGPAAMVAFKANRHIDLLMTDFQMPGMTGLELARELTRASPELPVLVVSGSPADELPLWELWRKRWCFLPKPTSAALLLKTVDHLCGTVPSSLQDEFLKSVLPVS